MLSLSLSPWANHLLNVVVIRPPSNPYLQRLCSHLGHSGSLWPTGARIRLNCLRLRRKNPGLREFNFCQSPSNHSKRLGERGKEPVVKNRRTLYSGLRRLHLVREGASGLLGVLHLTGSWLTLGPPSPILLRLVRVPLYFESYLTWPCFRGPVSF